MEYAKICKDCNKAFKSVSRGSQYCPDCGNKREKVAMRRYKSKSFCSSCGLPCKTGAKLCWPCKTERGRVSRICPTCGGIKRPQSKQCDVCYNRSIQRGEHNTKWKGGRRKDKTGYIMVYAPNHPRVLNSAQGRSRLYVAEHILIWEKAHNKFLPKGWILHHLNGIRDDNRYENLFAMRKIDHQGWTYIHALQTRIRELEQLHLPI